MKKPQNKGLVVSAATSQISPVYANAISQTAKTLIIYHSTLIIDLSQDMEDRGGVK